MRAKRYFGALIALATVASTAGFAATPAPSGTPAPTTKTPAASGGIIVVPPGHLSKTAPKVYSGSFVLTGLGGGSFATKYKKVYALFKNDPRLVASIKKAAAAYGIDPIHIIGAIVGEHTFNIDTYDSLQTYYVKALQYVDNTSLSFSFHGQTAQQLFAMPQFAKCEAIKSDYELWDCRQTVWNASFSGKMVNGKLYPPDRLHRVFFRPMYSGQTFGIGQLSPVAALMVTDVVHAKNGLPLLSIDNASTVYQQIMSPDSSVYYMAALIKVEIDTYKRIAGFDISKNPGISATLYNLGNAATRARELKATNDARKAKGLPPQLPQENFYGWLINTKEAELRQLL
jgi:hypothetical protein